MTKWLLAIGVVLGLVAVLLVNSYINQVKHRQQSEVFLRLKPDVALSKGDRLKPEMLRRERLPEDFGALAETAIRDTPVDLEWIMNRPVNADIKAGDFLLHTHFLDQPEERFAARIPINMRAMSIPVNRVSAVGYFVEPGSRVDLLGTFEETRRLNPRPLVTQPASNPSPGVSPELAAELRADPSAVQEPQYETRIATKTVLQNVRVLAVGRATTRGGYLNSDNFDTITLELTPQQSEILVFALSQTQTGLTLILRNPDDDLTTDIPNVSWEALQ